MVFSETSGFDNGAFSSTTREEKVDDDDDELLIDLDENRPEVVETVKLSEELKEAIGKSHENGTGDSKVRHVLNSLTAHF